MRPILSAVAGAAVAAIGALILGEYTFSGLAVVGSAVLLGLFVAEAVVAVRGPRPNVTVRKPVSEAAVRWASGALCALLTAVALVWAAWISSGHRLGTVAGEGWVAVVLGAAAAGVSGRRRGSPAHTPTESEP